MSVPITITDPVKGTDTTTQMPIEELIKETTEHKGSPMILGLSLLITMFGLWLMMLITFASSTELVVFVAPLCVIFAFAILWSLLFGYGWKGKSKLKFIPRRVKKAETLNHVLKF